jgi:hypothetical protein
MRVLVCGDRSWSDYKAIERELSLLPVNTTIIHGGARGADALAGDAARILNYTVIAYPARWDLYGKSAGPIRNREMLIDGMPELVLAFHPDISKSKGTKHMVQIATQAGVEVRVFNK